MLMNKACKLKGSTLIEVLVTMVIIAIGLLGQANLIAVSLKVNHSAFARTQATLLAYDIIERLRLNRALAVAGSFNSNYADDSASYTGNAIQDLELHDWKANVEQALPSGQAQVSVDGNGNVTINIQWSEVVKASSDGTITPTVFATQSVI
ncbi:type IV pilus modification protein PilV [Methylomonas sp. MgM2]